MKTFAIHTLGCKTNQLESSIIRKDLIDSGLVEIKFNEKADLYIINTCTVTSKSDSESTYLIKKAKRTNENAKVIVTGCYAQVAPEEIAQLQGAELIIGNSEKLNILRYVQLQDSKVHVADIMDQNTFIEKEIQHPNRTRANLKIQDGCNNRCSYCIIPFARGKSRSSKTENIIEQIRTLTSKGFKEVILTGIHLGQWGQDFEGDYTLVDLLKEIEKIDALDRYRLGSLDPQEFNPDLIELLEKSDKFCHHLHISLQSADNTTLKAMNRHYTVEMYSELIKNLHNKIQNIAIGCDIIVGFPGETDQHFENTYNNLKSLPLSYMHVFPYSIRKGTVAASMQGQIEDTQKKERAKKLKTLASAKNAEFKQSQVGKNLDILIEKARDKKTGLLKGVSSNYISVLVDGDDSLKNTLQRVTITNCENSTTMGKLATNNPSLLTNSL